MSLLSRLRSRRSRTPNTLATVPPGERVYAIGDIHGRDDLFSDLLGQIAADDAARSPATTTIILLGDLIDRGPASRQVIERAIRLRDAKPKLRWLVGNHEEVFLDALNGDERVMRFFIRIGGAATVHSYGIVSEDYRRMTIEELVPALRERVPTSHREFLAAGEDMIVIGDYAFVHAGIRPGVALGEQSGQDLRWIRDDFLHHAHSHGPVIVHGHTVTSVVEDTGTRIGIDTGAFASGKLTALGLCGTQRWLLSTAS